MKKFIFCFAVLCFALPLFATKQKTPPNLMKRPTTPPSGAAVADTAKTAPTDTTKNAVAYTTSKPKTVAHTFKPVSQAVVIRPTTRPTSPFGGTMDNSKQTSAEATYTKAKTLAPSNTDKTKATKMGKGEAGLGTKDAQAASKEKIADQKKPDIPAPNEETLKKLQSIGIDSKKIQEIQQGAAHRANGK